MTLPVWLSKPADVSFLVRLCLYGLVTGVCAFIARLVTEVIITSGVGFEGNPFSVFPTVETSGLIIAVGVGVAFSILFLWGQMQPQFKKWAEAVAIVGMLVVFFDAVWDVLLLLQSFR